MCVCVSVCVCVCVCVKNGSFRQAASGRDQERRKPTEDQQQKWVVGNTTCLIISYFYKS